MLDTRAERLNKGDLKGYLAPLSEEAQAAEQNFAQGSLTVPLSSRQLHLSASTPPPNSKTLKDIKVDFIYRYEGLPQDNTFRITWIYDLEDRDGSWHVAHSRPEVGTHFPIWANGPTETKRSEHFLALFHPGLAKADETMKIAEEARAQLAKKLSFPLEDDQLLLLARDRAEYMQLSARAAPVSAIAQAETAFEVTPSSITIRSRQIVLNLEKLFDDGAAKETFVHELGHLALAKQTRPFTPAWVSEAAAMFLAETRPVDTWKEGIRRGVFDTISLVQLNRASNLGLHDPSGEAASFEYAYASAASWYLTQTFGSETFFDFYESYTEVSASTFYDRLPEQRTPQQEEQAVATLAEETTTASIQKLFGISTSELDARVRQWIRNEIRKPGSRGNG
ncbi:MAG: hypothetical protein ABIS18_09155 [Actinomycetota bacterium]